MAKLPTIKRIIKEDFPDQPWIGKLLQPLNTFMESVVSALNKNLNMDNLRGNWITFTLNSSATAVNRFKVGIGSAPKVLIIGRIIPKDGGVITSAPYLDWSYSAELDQITIEAGKVFGFTADKTYEVTVLVLGE
jgi:hypothetical protein